MTDSLAAFDRVVSLLREIRDPGTRAKALRTLGVVVMVAGVSVGGTIAASQITTQVVTGLWQVFMERSTFPMISQEIESLRSDLSSAPCGSNAMLIAAAAETNKRIEHEHEANRRWYSDWASTDKWNAVERIAIPKCR